MILGPRIAARFIGLAVVSTAGMLALSLPGPASAAPAPQSGSVYPQSGPAAPVIPVLSAVWCSGSRQCLAVGSGYLNGSPADPESAVWNGVSWRFVSPPAKGHELAAIACTSFTNCMAVGDSGVVDHWNGRSWKFLSTPVKSSLTSVTCPDRQLCLAVSETAAILWRGRSWRRSSVPEPAGSLGLDMNGVTCWSTRGCLAVGAYSLRGSPEPYAATWNGKTWRLQPGQRHVTYEVACPARTYCLASGADGTELWNGRSWRYINSIINGVGGMSCLSASFCMLSNGNVTYVWNGRSWKILTSPGTGGPGLWCGSVSDCMAVGDDATQWNGHSWTTSRFFRDDSLRGVSCSGPTSCMVTGGTNLPAIAPYMSEQWDGASWRVTAGPPAPFIFPEPLSCPTRSFCMTSGYRWDGHRWIATPMPSVGDGIQSVSCTSSTNCVATGINEALLWNGAQWTATNAGISGQYVDLQSVSCVRSMCMAIGFNFLASCPDNCPTSQLAEQWNGTSWQVSSDVSVANYPVLSIISCPTATFCLATNETTAMTWQNGTWAAAPTTSPAFDTALSCGSPTDCMAIAFKSAGSQPAAWLAEVWNGTGWTVTKTKAPGSVLGDVSCVGDACLLVGTTPLFKTMAQRWNGTSWSLLNPIDP